MLGLNGHVEEIGDVHRHIRSRVERRLRRNDELRPHLDELEALLDALEYQPFWRRLRVVSRTAQIETDAGVRTFSEDVVLPDVKHNFDLVLHMLNYQREQRGLPEATMPLFVQPDELVDAGRNGNARCLCEDERDADARRRTLRRLGRKGMKPWQRARRRVFDRDDWKCTQCGAERDIHVHRVDPDLPWKERDGWVTLCRTCHVVPSRETPPPEGIRGIRSQLALVIKKGRIEWVGLVFGGEYYLLRS